MNDANWPQLETEEQLQDVIKNSKDKPQLIFKHSTSCSISSLVFGRFTNAWQKNSTDGIQINYLDLLRFRNVSNAIESAFEVRHESPQVLIIIDGKCVSNSSHLGISYSSIVEEFAN